MSGVAVEWDGAVATITLPSPALSRALKKDLREVTRAVAEDSNVRAVVLTGTGKAFCVGQDLAEHAAALDEDPATAMDTVDLDYNPIVTTLATMPKPVVAAVNGTCVGAGLGFVLACDMVVMASGAVLGTAFTGIGLTCDSGMSVTVERCFGLSRARALLLQPRTFTAEEAVSWGLAATLVPAGEVRTAAASLATTLAAGPTVAYARTKQLLWDSLARPLSEALTAESAAQHELSQTADHAGAVTAFLAKQKPAFQGA
ncbi:MAG TPA: enoyl-CoA hydratase-related protein [Trebonia sp.]|nr:enoyl-CoA hydratase-related protein [Trebonia sp.]